MGLLGLICGLPSSTDPPLCRTMPGPAAPAPARPLSSGDVGEGERERSTTPAKAEEARLDCSMRLNADWMRRAACGERGYGTWVAQGVGG